jgi:hypothetical protein
LALSPAVPQAELLMPARSDYVQPSIAIRREGEPQRLRVILKGPLTGLAVAQALGETYVAEPDVTRLDMLFDLTEYQGAVGPDDVEMIVEAYQKSDPNPLYACRTAFVTPDPFFHHWAAAMSFQFSGREHRAFPTFEKAEAFLAEPIDQRPPFAPE